MNERIPPQKTKGLDDWVEIFRAGDQVARDGTAFKFTAADLDQMIESHQAGFRAPLVIGHPKENDPAYGWADQLKRDGNSLFAKFRDVTPEFAAAVDAGHYRSRSVRVIKDLASGKWLVDHIGFLGAQRPAIPLAPMEYQAPAGEAYDFEAPDSYTPGVMARTLRRLREFFIDKFGAEDADRVLPDWDIESLADHATQLREPEPNAPAFTAPETTGDDPMSKFSQEDIDAALKKAREDAAAEFAAKEQNYQEQLQSERRQRQKAEFSAFINQAVDDEHLTPAQAEGAAEFMASLAGIEVALEFSAGEGDKAEQVKKAPLDWFKEFIGALPKHGLTQELGGQDAQSGERVEFAAAAGYAVDADQLGLHRKALDYQAAHPGTEYLAAVKAVSA